MNINKDLEIGIKITGDDWEYLKCIRKPNVNTKIIREFWFKGTNKKLMETLKER